MRDVGAYLLARIEEYSANQVNITNNDLLGYNLITNYLY